MTGLKAKSPHVSTLCSESELFDTALENYRAHISFFGRFRTPVPQRPCGMRLLRLKHGPTNANSINSPVRLAQLLSAGNSYRRGRFGLAWYGGNNDALKLLMSSV